MAEPNDVNIDMASKKTDSTCLTRRFGRLFKSKSARNHETFESVDDHSFSDVKSGREVNPLFENDPTPAGDQPIVKPKDDNTVPVVNAAITTTVDITESKNTENYYDNDDIPVTGNVTNDGNNRNMYQTDYIGSRRFIPLKDEESTERMLSMTSAAESGYDDGNNRNVDQADYIGRRRSTPLKHEESTESMHSVTSAAESGYDSLGNELDETVVTTIKATIEGNLPEHMRIHQKPTKSDSNKPNELERILTKLTELSRARDLLPGELARKRMSLPNKFAAAFLTKTGGGYLSISVGNHKRASLYIPPEALSHDDPQLVYIYIPPSFQTPSNGTQSKEARVTPTVRCGPAGLQFSKPIFLTISYKFDIDSTSMQVMSYQKKTSDGESWLPFPDQAVTIAQKNEVTILLNHFCDYECTGVSNSCRWVKVSVTVERVDVENCDVFVNLHSVLDKHGDYAAMEVEENGENIHVNINEIDKSWIVTNQPCKEIDIKKIWSTDPSAASSASDTIQVIKSFITHKFTAKLRKKSELSDNFSANIDVNQHNNHRPRINLKAVHKTVPEATNLDAFEIEQDVTDQFLGNFFNDSPYFLSQTNYTGICMALDTATLDDQGWKSFGSEIGIPRKQVLDWMGTKQNPSALLLDFFMKDIRHHQDVFEKLQSLKKIFVKIGNHDAKRFVEQELADRVSVTPTKYGWRVSMDSGFSSRSQSFNSVGLGDTDLYTVLESDV